MSQRKIIIFTACALLVFACTAVIKSKGQHSFTPGEIWQDNRGVHINAHGGGILKSGEVYFWFGEHKTEAKAGNNAHVGVHCYSSTDLYNWKDEGIALSVITNDTTHLITKGCILERPKVIYNKKTINMSCGSISSHVGLDMPVH